MGTNVGGQQYGGHPFRHRASLSRPAVYEVFRFCPSAAPSQTEFRRTGVQFRRVEEGSVDAYRSQRIVHVLTAGLIS
jgi:hypothetical protein